MATEQFARTINVTSSVDEAWKVLTDAERIVSWVEIIHSVTEIEHLKSYTAILEDRVGPFRLRADLTISATVADGGHVIELSASGQDRSVGSQLRINARLAVEGRDGGSVVEVSGDYAVTGRVASMGGNVVRKKGDAAIDQFVSKATAELGSPE